MRNKRTQYGLEEIIREFTLPIRISSNARDKADYISKRVVEMTQNPLLEVSMLLLSGKDNREGRVVVEDVYIAKNQEVRPAHCTITGLGMANSKRDIKDNLEMRVVGWGHSHANMATFHSDEDNDTLLNFLDTNYTILRTNSIVPDDGNDQNFKFVQVGNKIMLKVTQQDGELYLSSEYFDRMRGVQTPTISISTFRKKQIEIHYTISLVFNANGDAPYCAVAYRFNNNKYFIGQVPVEVIKSTEPVQLDYEQIHRELIERVDVLRNLNIPETPGTAEDSFTVLVNDYSSAQSYLKKSRNDPNIEVQVVTAIESYLGSIIKLIRENSLEEGVGEFKKRLRKDLRQFKSRYNEIDPEANNLKLMERYILEKILEGYEVLIDTANEALGNRRSK